MPNDRLDALRRQRSLVAQHLAWLDAEIAAADDPAAPAVDHEPRSTAPEAASPVTPTPPALPNALAPAAEADVPSPPTAPTEEERLAIANARANAILEEYSVTDRFDPAATRRGCFLFAVAVFLFAVAGLLAVYFFAYR